MIKEDITLDDFLKILNEIASVDPEAMKNLIEARVPCNDELVNHPEVQVGAYEGVYKVGILGILNGIFGTYEEGKYEGYGPVCAIIYINPTQITFRRTGEVLKK